MWERALEAVALSLSREGHQDLLSQVYLPRAGIRETCSTSAFWMVCEKCGVIPQVAEKWLPVMRSLVWEQKGWPVTLRAGTARQGRQTSHAERQVVRNLVDPQGQKWQSCRRAEGLLWPGQTSLQLKGDHFITLEPGWSILGWCSPWSRDSCQAIALPPLHPLLLLAERHFLQVIFFSRTVMVSWGQLNAFCLAF